MLWWYATAKQGHQRMETLGIPSSRDQNTLNNAYLPHIVQMFSTGAYGQATTTNEMFQQSEVDPIEIAYLRPLFILEGFET